MLGNIGKRRRNVDQTAVGPHQHVLPEGNHPLGNLVALDSFVVLVLAHGSHITIPAAFDGSRPVAECDVLAGLAAQAVLRRLGIVAVEAEQRRVRRHQDGAEAGGSGCRAISQLCEKMTERRIAEQVSRRLHSMNTLLGDGEIVRVIEHYTTSAAASSLTPVRTKSVMCKPASSSRLRTYSRILFGDDEDAITDYFATLVNVSDAARRDMDMPKPEWALVRAMKLQHESKTLPVLYRRIFKHGFQDSLDIIYGDRQGTSANRKLRQISPEKRPCRLGCFWTDAKSSSINSSRGTTNERRLSA